MITSIRRMTASDLMLAFVLCIIAFFSISPILHVLAVSLSERVPVTSGKVLFLPVGLTFYNYMVIWDDPKFYRALWVSVERVILGGVVNFLLTVLMAFPLSRDPKIYRPRNAVMWFLIFVMIFNAGIVPWYLTIMKYGLLDSIWALVLPGAVPIFSIILLVNFFRSLPKDLDEACHMDGAGPWYMLFKIYIPLSLPSLATVTLFSIVGHWNSFFDGLVLMNTASNWPLQAYIQSLTVNLNGVMMDEDQAKLMSQLSITTLNSAKMIVAMIPIVIIYPFLQKYLIGGILLGAVKE